MELMENDFNLTNLRISILITTVRNEKKDYLIVLTKIAGIIKKLVDKNLKHF